MPDPIRPSTRLILPPALLDDEPLAELKAEGTAGPEAPVAGAGRCPGAVAGGGVSAGGAGSVGGGATGARAASSGASVLRLGMPLKRDPYDRDGGSSCSRGRLETKHGWSVEPLMKYLKGVAVQIDTNLRDERLPTAERLEAFVAQLVTNTQRQLKHAPRKDRHTLQAMFERRFQKFWDFARNQKVRTTTPEELRWVLVSLEENLFAEFAGSADVLLLAQPKPVHYQSLVQLRCSASADAARG